MADQLDGYPAPGPPGRNNALSDEKRAIAEIEEAVVERIRSLDRLAGGAAAAEDGDDDASPPDSPPLFENGAADAFTPMHRVCDILFAKHSLA